MSSLLQLRGKQMPVYNDLRPKKDFEKTDFLQIFPDIDVETKLRAIKGIIRLKMALGVQIPARKSEENLLIASWNIKEFGHTKQRRPEAYLYIAEIISNFDLVVIQEVKSTLKDLYLLKRLLGNDWEYLVSDITSGKDGNSERSAYVYNTKRVKLSGIAGELVLWDEITEDSEIKQLKRTPYLTGFRAGWKDFAMLSVHLEPDKDKKSVAFRQEEVRLLLAALKRKIKEQWTSRLIIAGDFNFYKSKDGPTVEMFNNAGFREIDSLKNLDTNASGSEVFDRMFVNRGSYFQIVKDAYGEEKGGVFDPFKLVYREGEETLYRDLIIEDYGGNRDIENDPEVLRSQFQTYWKRNQISDHLPIWFELNIDDSVSFLDINSKALEEEKLGLKARDAEISEAESV
ncbi:MAG: endonuclease/exonuclease/phosphatase family protein [Pseudomonadota bacterium]